MNIKLKDIAYQQLDELDSNKLDKTINSDSALKLPDSTDAFEAADILTSRQATSIIVTSDAQEIKGVIFPHWVQSQLLIARGIDTDTFTEALSFIKQEGDENVSDSGVMPSYHHEWLNLDRPVLFWCDKGEHYIDTNTCPYHK